MTVTLLILLVVLIAMVGVVLTQMLRQRPGTESSLLVQQQIDALRGDMREHLQNATVALNQLRDTTTHTINQQLSSVTQQLQNNTGQVGTRLDNAAKVIGEVQNKLGELGKATQEIRELGQSVSKLEEMLKAPKLRGGLGELLLENLLRQVLSANAVRMQYTFRNGHTVDAVIITEGRMVPVDSKFPLENFRKMVDAKSDAEKKTAARLFRADVRKHIDAIADKYILPDEGTFDFALMYIPAENIYYETIIKDESFAEEDGLYAYATKRRVVPVSPNSFYAYLRVIELGLRGLQIEQSARVIYENLERLSVELGKFSELFETLGTQLNNAKNNYDKADKQLGALSEKFKSVQSLPESSGKPRQIEGPGGPHERIA